MECGVSSVLFWRSEMNVFDLCVFLSCQTGDLFSPISLLMLDWSHSKRTVVKFSNEYVVYVSRYQYFDWINSWMITNLSICHRRNSTFCWHQSFSSRWHADGHHWRTRNTTNTMFYLVRYHEQVIVKLGRLVAITRNPTTDRLTSVMYLFGVLSLK